MRKNIFISFFITAHVVLIFLQVHKHTLLIKNSYNQQQCEKQLAMLHEKKQTAIQELYALKDRENIKKFAHEKLNMRPYALHQVKKIALSS